MRKYPPLLIAMILAGTVLLGASCGLKGPPMPPEMKGSGARSGSGVLQFGPKEQKMEPEEERILRLYGLGKKPAEKSHLPGPDEAFGIGGPEDPAKKWMAPEEMNPNWLPDQPSEEKKSETPPPSDDPPEQNE